jgi:hypothetical protein
MFYVLIGIFIFILQLLRTSNRQQVLVNLLFALFYIFLWPVYLIMILINYYQIKRQK